MVLLLDSSGVFFFLLPSISLTFNMLVKNLLPLLALVKLAVSLPAAPIPPSEGLRLVKVSEDDEGTWVTEDEKFDLFISKRINFVDITDTWVSFR